MKKASIISLFSILFFLIMILYSCVPTNENNNVLNNVPKADFSYAPTEIVEGREVEFDPTLSSDAEDSDANLSARWDFDGDGVWEIDYSTGKKAIDKVRHIYTIPGKYKVVLEVKDKGGETAKKEKEIVVELAPPQNLRMIDKGDSWIQLGWIDISNNEDSYKLYRDGVEIVVLGSNTEEYTDTEIDFSATHTYSVVACKGEEYSKNSELEIGINSEQIIKIEDIEVTVPGTYTGNEIVVENVGLVGEEVGEYEIESEGYKIYVEGADGEIEDIPIEIKYNNEDNGDSVLMTYIEGVGWIPLLTLEDDEGNIYTYLNDFEIFDDTQRNGNKSGIFAKAKIKNTDALTQISSQTLDKAIGRYSIDSISTVETPNFDPSINGLKFGNFPKLLHNVDHPLLSKFNLTEPGLCFGMSVTVKGLLRYNLPSDKSFCDISNDYEGNAVVHGGYPFFPNEEYRVSQDLLEFVIDQQNTQSWARIGVSLETLTLIGLNPINVNIGNFNRALIKMSNSNDNEKPKLIILDGAIGRHAVLAYKIKNYDHRGEVYIYDPSYPSEERVITIDHGLIRNDYSGYLYFVSASKYYTDPRGIEEYENLVDKIYVPRFLPFDLGVHYYTNTKTVRLKWWYHAKPDENPSTKIWRAEGNDIFYLIGGIPGPSEKEQDLYEDSNVTEGNIYKYIVGYDCYGNRQSTERYVKTVDFEVTPGNQAIINPDQLLKLTVNSPDGSYDSWRVYAYDFNNNSWNFQKSNEGISCSMNILLSDGPPFVNNGISRIRVVGFKNNGWQSYFAVKDLEYVVQDQNNPPAQPTNPTPYDGQTNVSLTPTLSWEATDPDGDSLTFDIYFGTSSNPPLVKQNHTSNTYDPGSLNYNTKYYWKIVAKDGKGGETEGPIWSFTTEELITGDISMIAAVGPEGLVIFDVSDPTNPQQVGHCNTDGWAEGVYVSGNYAYVADHYNGLVIIDISNPTNPQQIGHYDTDGNAWNVYVSGSYAYVADEGNGLVIIDISDPTNPQKVGHLDTDGYAYGVYISGNYAYVADEGNGLVVIGISDSTNPQKVGHLDTDGYAYGVYISGNYAYVADDDNGLVIIDISNPTNPQEVGHLDTGYAYDIYVSGNYAYVADNGSGLVIIGISDPENPQQVGHLDTDGYAYGVYISGNYAYVADDDNGLVIIDISNPTNPRQVGHYDTNGCARDVYISGNYAYVADYDNGLVIIDTTNPTNPQQIGHYDTNGCAYDVYVSGDYAYVADRGNGLVIIDISVPTNPKQIGHCDTNGYARGVYVSGNYAYVADYDNGLVIIDTTNPTNPQQIGHYDTNGCALDVYVSGNYAYVADRHNGLVIIDTTNPTNPKQIGHCDTNGYARGVYVSGNYAYVADDDNGLVIIDTTNPTNPQQIGHYDTNGCALDVYVSGNYAYVADYDNGLVIIDITNPTNPKQIGHCNTDGWAEDVYVSGNYAYVADYDNGLVIIDITNPTNPTLLSDMFWVALWSLTGY